jgi:hypothetical protein
MELLTIKEVSKILKMSESSIRKLIFHKKFLLSNSVTKLFIFVLLKLKNGSERNLLMETITTATTKRKKQKPYNLAIIRL